MNGSVLLTDVLHHVNKLVHLVLTSSKVAFVEVNQHKVGQFHDRGDHARLELALPLDECPSVPALVALVEEDVDLARGENAIILVVECFLGQLGERLCNHVCDHGFATGQLGARSEAKREHSHALDLVERENQLLIKHYRDLQLGELSLIVHDQGDGYIACEVVVQAGAQAHVCRLEKVRNEEALRHV